MTDAYNPSGIFCNRTLNLRRIQAIGYDMDYTLIHYYVRAWERRSYRYLREALEEAGWPVGTLEFDRQLAMRGLIIDTAEGNVVKANRFGYVKRAFHGTRRLDFERQRRMYARTLIDLDDDRWYFLNTLFGISEACMYMQMVDLLDQEVIERPTGVGRGVYGEQCRESRRESRSVR